MARKDPTQISEKYQRGVSSAGQDYAAGVQNPSRSWSQATQQGAKRWQAGIQQAIAQGSFQKGVQAAGDQKWQAAAAGRGVANYANAATYAGQAYAQQAAKIMAAAAAAQNAVASLPNDTLQARIQRSAAAQMAIHNHWKGPGA
jgi:hypothetical protein